MSLKILGILFVRYSETISLFCSLFRNKKKSKQNKKHNPESRFFKLIRYNIYAIAQCKPKLDIANGEATWDRCNCIPKLDVANVKATWDRQFFKRQCVHTMPSHFLKNAFCINFNK